MRLRQIALVAEKLEPVIDDITSVLGINISYRDPGVGVFGLENAVMPLGGNFLEVVAPVEDNTAAGRYLERRRGDGGYMIILQCPDALKERERIMGLGIRSVFNIDRPSYQATHFHPRDVGNILLSIDSVEPGEDYTAPMCMWEPAGPDWEKAVKTDVVSELVGVELQSDNPADLAALWSRVLDLPATRDAGDCYRIDLRNAVIRFVTAIDGRGTGVGAIDIRAVDRSRLLSAADARGCRKNNDELILGGLRINIV